MQRLLLIFILSLFFINAGQCQNSDKSLKYQNNLYPQKEIVSHYHNDWTQKNYRKRINDFKKKPLKQGEIVFLGNSITQQGNNWSKKFGINHIRNRGIAGDVTDGALKRLNEIVYSHPKAVFILIGINDLFNMHHDMDKKHNFKYDKIVPSDKYVAKNIMKIAKIIHRKSPDTKIYVRTIMPTRREYLKTDILAVNKYLEKYEAKGFYSIIDFYSLFVDSNGDMTKELTRDGVHLNDAGYQKWIQKEKPIIEKLYQLN